MIGKMRENSLKLTSKAEIDSFINRIKFALEDKDKAHVCAAVYRGARYSLTRP